MAREGASLVYRAREHADAEGVARQLFFMIMREERRAARLLTRDSQILKVSIMVAGKTSDECALFLRGML
jgi:hypothetical protein